MVIKTTVETSVPGSLFFVRRTKGKVGKKGFITKTTAIQKLPNSKKPFDVRFGGGIGNRSFKTKKAAVSASKKHLKRLIR